MSSLYDNNWLYDLVHEKAPDHEQVSFYEKQIERYGEPVLELACGTGNYLVTLSQHNVDITGLDLSEEMLEGAQKKADRQDVETNLINGDMRNFSLDEKFSLIFIGGNSLQHLNTREDVAMCFDSVKRHLRPGGRFIVEVFNPSLQLLTRDPNQRYFLGEYKTENGWVVLEENVRYDPATQINHIDWHYRNQYVKEEQTVSFTMRQYFPQEFDSLFLYNGLRIEEKYGDFDCSPFSSTSPKQIIVAGL